MIPKKIYLGVILLSGISASISPQRGPPQNRPQRPGMYPLQRQMDHPGPQNHPEYHSEHPSPPEYQRRPLNRPESPNHNVHPPNRPIPSNQDHISNRRPLPSEHREQPPHPQPAQEHPPNRPILNHRPGPQEHEGHLENRPPLEHRENLPNRPLPNRRPIPGEHHQQPPMAPPPQQHMGQPLNRPIAPEHHENSPHHDQEQAFSQKHQEQASSQEHQEQSSSSTSPQEHKEEQVNRPQVQEHKDQPLKGPLPLVNQQLPLPPNRSTPPPTQGHPQNIPSQEQLPNHRPLIPEFLKRVPNLPPLQRPLNRPPKQQPHKKSPAKSSEKQNRNADSIKFIGPHNLHDHYFELRWAARTTNKSLLDSIKSTYNIRPIVRDLNLSRMNDKDIFTIVMKREIAWSHPDMNEFGLMRCEDLRFRSSPFAGYIELIPEGRRIAIQKFDDSESYQKVSKAAKELQNWCLIKNLEKTPSTQPAAATAQSLNIANCKTKIPFCFSDTWRQIWWKLNE